MLKYSAAWKYWPLKPQANLVFVTGNDHAYTVVKTIFYTRQNRGVVYRVKFAMGEKIRQCPNKEKYVLPHENF